MLRPSIVLGGGVSVALVAIVALIATGDPSSDLETDALVVPTSTIAETTTSPGRAVAASSNNVAPRRLVEAADSGLEVDADQPLGGNLFVPRQTTTSTTTSTSTTSSTTTTAPPTTLGPAPVRIPTPSCATGLGAATPVIAPFLGATAEIPSGLPAVVVKVSNNNSSSRRALIGLDEADVVFEERIEASATRFAAVFHSRLPSNVGPVRSGRTTDIQILRNLGTPVLGYSGSNNGVAGQFADAAASGWFVPVVNTDRAPFARDSRYRAPDNLFVDPTSLGACGDGGTPTPIFEYGEPSSTTSEPAASVSLQARSPFRFDWNAASGTWHRSQDGTDHLTRTGQRLAPDNVVVLFVRYVPSSIDASSVDAETVGSGDAWILRDGSITEGSWRRDRPLRGYTLTDANGIVTNLAPGSTWVVLAPAGSASWN